MVMFCLSCVRWLAEFLRRLDRGGMGRGLQTSLQCLRKANVFERHIVSEKVRTVLIYVFVPIYLSLIRK